MNFKFFIISILITSGLVGGAFALVSQLTPQEFTQEEIEQMKNSAVLITTNESTILIEFYPEDAPNTVHNFLELVKRGHYDGTLFHRIIHGFMIQGGDPNTKNPDRSMWGQGGAGYQINEEFNTLQHDRGAVSMARGNHPDSASSQFFIVHRDANFLDGKYTVFGSVVPGLGGLKGVDRIAELQTDSNDAPIEVENARILSAKVLYPYTSSGLGQLDRIESIIKERSTFVNEAGQATTGDVLNYTNDLHGVSFDIPYRWKLTEGEGINLNITMEPGGLEHSAQQQIERSGFVPQIVVM